MVARTRSHGGARLRSVAPRPCPAASPSANARSRRPPRHAGRPFRPRSAIGPSRLAESRMNVAAAARARPSALRALDRPGHEPWRRRRGVRPAGDDASRRSAAGAAVRSRSAAVRHARARAEIERIAAHPQMNRKRPAARATTCFGPRVSARTCGRTEPGHLQPAGVGNVLAGRLRVEVVVEASDRRVREPGRPGDVRRLSLDVDHRQRQVVGARRRAGREQVGVGLAGGAGEHDGQLALDLDPRAQLARAQAGAAGDRRLHLTLGHQVREQPGADPERPRASRRDVNDLRVGGVDEDPSGGDPDLELAALRRDRDRVGDRKRGEDRGHVRRARQECAAARARGGSLQLPSGVFSPGGQPPPHSR